MAQAAQHETGNFFDQYWIVTLCLRDVLWIYLKKKNFILVIREFLFSCDFRIVKSWNRFVIHESRIVNSNPECQSQFLEKNKHRSQLNLPFQGLYRGVEVQ